MAAAVAAPEPTHAASQDTFIGGPGPAFTITPAVPPVPPVPQIPAVPAAVVSAVPPAAPAVVPPAEPVSKEGEPPAQSKAPEKYALVPPVGTEAWLDATDVAQVEAQARAAGFTQEQAQAALDGYADQLAAQSAGFRQQVEADTVYGGAHIGETQANARRFLDQFRPVGTTHGDALRRILNKTGFANHLEVVSLFADVGKMIAEDKPVGGRETAGQPLDLADRLYATTP